MGYDRDYQSKSDKIKKQAEDLLMLHNEKHQKDIEIKRQELALKQKDMDTVLANQAMQIKLKENIVDQLNQVVKSESPSKQIRSVILELKGQVEAQKKMAFLNENLEEVNTALYERLLTNHPDLTKSEREMCTYIRLGLSTKEIASLKNITENSVNVLKSRLRKKINLTSNHELGPYLLKY
jgi:DNA-binding CsgD family transcriptional regulator